MITNTTASRMGRLAVFALLSSGLMPTAASAQTAAAAKQVFVVPFSHLDLWYLGPPENSYARAERIFSYALEQAERDPDFRFTFENAYYLREYLSLRPEARDRIAKMLGSGRLDLSGQWSDMNQSEATAEDLVRDVLLAHRFAQRELNFQPQGVISADIPGFTPQVVQIWKQSGIRGAMLTRGGPLKTPIFQWQAPDGSKLPIGYTVGGYATGWMAGLAKSLEAAEGKVAVSSYHSVQKKELKFDTGLAKLVDKSFPGSGPAILGAGPDLSVPSAEMTRVIREWNQRHGKEMFVREVTVPEFVDAIAKDPLPVLSGDWQSVWQMAIQSADRYAMLARVSHRLASAEKVATIASLLTPMQYPEADLERAWQWQIAAQDHEGAALPDFPHRAQELAAAVEQQSAAMIASRIPAQRKDAMVVVAVNPVNWPRRVALRVPLFLHGDIPSDGSRWDNIVVRDEKGNPVPARIRPAAPHAVTRTAELYTLIDLPPLGYRSLLLEPGGDNATGAAPWETPKPEISAGRQPVTALLGGWEAKYDPATRTIALASNGHAVATVELDHLAAAKAADLEAVRPVGDSAVEWRRVRLEQTWSEAILRAEAQITGGRIFLQVALRDGMAPEITTGGEWVSSFEGSLVQRVIPAALTRDAITYGIPFGEEKFGSMLPDSGPTNAGDELAPEVWKNAKTFDGWLAWEDGNARVTFATEARGAIFSPRDFSIVVAPTRGVMPSSVQQITLRSTLNFEQSPAAGAERLMWELMEPPVIATAEDRFGVMNLPPQFSLLEWDDPHLVVSAVYRDDQRNVVLRTYAHSSQPLHSQLRTELPVGRIELISPVETVMGPASPSREFGPWQIQTLRLQVAGARFPAQKGAK